MGGRRLTEQDLKDMGLREIYGVWRKVKAADQKENAPISKKKSKYGNKKCKDELGNIFDSKKELARWGELQLLYRANAITELRRQVWFELNPGGAFQYRYKADFTYKEGSQFIVEDSKGARTKVYLKKRKLMLEIHGITIKET